MDSESLCTHNIKDMDRVAYSVPVPGQGTISVYEWVEKLHSAGLKRRHLFRVVIDVDADWLKDRGWEIRDGLWHYPGYPLMARDNAVVSETCRVMDRWIKSGVVIRQKTINLTKIDKLLCRI